MDIILKAKSVIVFPSGDDMLIKISDCSINDILASIGIERLQNELYALCGNITDTEKVTDKEEDTAF